MQRLTTTFGLPKFFIPHHCIIGDSSASCLAPPFIPSSVRYYVPCLNYGLRNNKLFKLSDSSDLFMVEQVKYQVVKTIDKIEVRHYPRLIIARVDGYGDSGFNILFQYISGNNRQKTSLEMTAPVLSERIKMTAPVLSDSGSLAFVIPHDYSLETTPEPLDERVKIIEISERFVAALRFSGRWSESIFNKKSKELMDNLAKLALKTKGSVFVMRYSGPFTPWFLRRNEVAIEVEPDKSFET